MRLRLAQVDANLICHSAQKGSFRSAIQKMAWMLSVMSCERSTCTPCAPLSMHLCSAVSAFATALRYA